MSRPFTLRDDDKSEKAEMMRKAFERAFNECHCCEKNQSTDQLNGHGICSNCLEKMRISENEIKSLQEKVEELSEIIGHQGRCFLTERAERDKYREALIMLDEAIHFGFEQSTWPDEERMKNCEQDFMRQIYANEIANTKKLNAAKKFAQSVLRGEQ